MRLAGVLKKFELDPDGNGGWIYFQCPAHPDVHMDWIGVPFSRTQSAIPPVWGWNGESDPEKISLTPSIDAHHHWHGFLTDGELRTAA